MQIHPAGVFSFHDLSKGAVQRFPYILQSTASNEFLTFLARETRVRFSTPGDRINRKKNWKKKRKRAAFLEPIVCQSSVDPNHAQGARQ